MRLKFEPVDVCEVYFYFFLTIIALKKKEGRIIILVHIILNLVVLFVFWLNVNVVWRTGAANTISRSTKLGFVVKSMELNGLN